MKTKSSKNKPQITKDMLSKLAEKGFFDGEGKTIKDTLQKLSQKGYTIPPGRKIGLVAQLLTYLCRDDVIEREELPKEEWTNAGGKWKYKKI